MKATLLHDKQELLTTIGVNIRNLIQTNGGERKKLASHLNITTQALGHIENGKTDLPISRIFQIAEFFNVPYTSIVAIEKCKSFNINNYNNENCTINNAEKIITEDLNDAKINKLGKEFYTIIKGIFDNTKTR